MGRRGEGKWDGENGELSVIGEQGAANRKRRCCSVNSQDAREREIAHCVRNDVSGLPKSSAGGSGGLLGKGGFGGEAEAVEAARLHLGAEIVDGIYARIDGADAIADLPLTGRRLQDGENGVGHVLRIAACREQRGIHFLGYFRGGTVGFRADVIRGSDHAAKDGSLIGAGLKDAGFNSLPREFVAIGFGERFEREFRGGINTEARKNDASREAADVEEQAAALFAHEGQDGAIHAQDAKEVGLEELARLGNGSRFGEADDTVAGVVDDRIDAASAADAFMNDAVDGNFVGNVHFENIDLKRFLADEGAQLVGVGGIAHGGVAHSSKNDVAMTREGFREKAAKAGAGAGDEDNLGRCHRRSFRDGVVMVDREGGRSKEGDMGILSCRW